VVLETTDASRYQGQRCLIERHDRRGRVDDRVVDLGPLLVGPDRIGRLSPTIDLWWTRDYLTSILTTWARW